MQKQKHLSLENRILIESLLNDRRSFKSIARHLGKDCTTVSKEVRGHLRFERSGAYGGDFNDAVVSPLLEKGQSLHHIAVHHADEPLRSERTLYA